MIWEPVIFVAKFKNYRLEVYKRMDDPGWGLRIFKGNLHLIPVGERCIDGMSLIRAKKLCKKLAIKHRRLSK